MSSIWKSLTLALLLVSGTADAALDWRPFYPLLGHWAGTRDAGGARINVSRDYETVAGNQHLLITEKASSRAPWGLIAYDDASDSFVLRRFAADGGERVLKLETIAPGGATLIFVGPAATAGGSERITFERQGWDQFTERVEVASDGANYALESEAHFRRRS